MRTIVHLDADAFFASVEQASDPRLRGLPVAVGGEKRGIIASASYEARKFGVFTPMPTVRARKLCPKLIVLPGDFDKYEHFSRWMFSYAQDFTPDVEIASIDEGYFDLSAVPKPPRQVAQTIRDAIRQALKITVSEGLASNKLVSAIASKLSKPAAFREVPAGGEIPFLHPLPNSWLPGVGPQTAQRLDAAGLALIAQIAATPTDLLHLLVGSLAPALKAHADGIDERPVLPLSAPAKSYSQQQTFAADLTDEDYAEAVLRHMADELMARVRADGKTIRTLTVKVRYNDMAEDQRSESLSEPTDLETDLYGRIQVLLRQAWKRRVSLRLVSLKLANVYDGRFRAELALERSAGQHEARRRLAGVVDELRRACGAGVLLRGHDFRLREGPSDTAKQLTEQGAASARPVAIRRPAAVTCVPLAMHSAYSFQDSTLSIAALVALGREHELPALALADTGNLHGAVEFTQAAQQAGIKPILGTTLNLAGQPVRLYVQNAAGYQNLCRLLSRVGNPRRGWSAEIPVRLGSVRPGKADQHVRAPGQNEQHWSRMAEDAGVGPVVEGSVAARQRAPLHAAFFHQAAEALDGLLAVSADTRLASLFGDRFYLAVTGPEMAQAAAGARCVPLLPAHYARRADRWRWNILQAIRTGTLLQQTHPEKQLAGDFHLRTPTEMAELFRDYPDVLANPGELAERCSFVLPIGALQFPEFHPPDGSSPRAFLRQLVLAGARQRYGAAGSAAQRPQLEEELTIIAEVGYEAYFLVVWDLLQECRRRGIEWITRGSAADSLVCYCLGISDVCPIRFDLYFRRFLNRERMAMKKLPDIDVDFAHDRKDDVVDLIFAKYGAAHAAVVGGFSTFQARSAFAEIAKVLGVAERETRKFTDHFPWRFGGGWVPDEPTPSGGAGLIEMLRASPENRDLPLEEEPCRTALLMAEMLDGMPRYPKMHPCGVVLSGQAMVELTPTFTSHQGRPTTHFDMDAVEAIGLVKIDILAQGGLAAMRDARQSLARRGIEVDLGALAPWQDANVWELIASGGARAVHHIESPAMIGLCRQCNVRDIDGLIAIVSVIRPGAANEGKKQSFARRYQRLEPVTYPHPSLAACLRSTFGLVVYEEHILQMCEAFAGLPPGRADVLRRALAKQKRPLIEEIRREFVAAAQARGHDDAKTAEVWSLVSGFAGYAFCKAHSTAYGVEAYQAAWLKCYHPAEFMAAVLTNGKGFYHPLVYVLECHRLGLRLLPPSVNDPGPAFEVVEISAAETKLGSTSAASIGSALPETRANGQRFRSAAVSSGPAAATPHLAAAGPEDTAALRRFWCSPVRTSNFGLRTSAIRVPLTRVKGLSERTKDRLLAERQQGPFISLADFHRRVAPGPDEMEALIRVGAFDEWGQPRTAQIWAARHLQHGCSHADAPGQGWLLPPPATDRLPPGPLAEPTRHQRLAWELELLGFPASGHPLELHDDIAWETYCPVSRLGEFLGQQVVTCGLIIEQRTHHQITGEPMKFLTLADWTGMVETELFAPTYRSYGLATVRYPVLEITATVEPFENARGFSLRVQRAGCPRSGQRKASLPMPS